MTASYEARGFGVHSAMPSRTAVGLCRDLVIVPARFDAYHEASRSIMGIFEQNACVVEPLSLDEAFLDVSDRVRSVEQAASLGRTIKAAVRDMTQLTISLGIAGSKLVAKIASDYVKPDGLTIVKRSEVREFLAPLPVRKLWGVGPKTEAVLRREGIERVGQLANASDEWLLQHLGPWSVQWRALARGEDSRRVSTRARSKQISRELTFDRDTADEARLRECLASMVARLVESLRETGPARTVHIKLRYSDFRTITRQRRALASANTGQDITFHAWDLLDASWDRRPVRLIGVGLSNFVESAEDQLSLFPDSESQSVAG